MKTTNRAAKSDANKNLRIRRSIEATLALVLASKPRNAEHAAQLAREKASLRALLG